ncbi:MAG: hypothetical protein QNJ31_07475 [Candidatus Caenarcaniphilales bacterium]|nr:hypothetical protein [Candidatus Caenarcaniphilales bacterium]
MSIGGIENIISIRAPIHRRVMNFVDRKKSNIIPPKEVKTYTVKDVFSSFTTKAKGPLAWILGGGALILLAFTQLANLFRKPINWFAKFVNNCNRDS